MDIFYYTLFTVFIIITFFRLTFKILFFTGDEVEVWMSRSFWEYIFARALQDDLHRIVRASNAKRRRIRAQSNASRRGSWSVTTRMEMEVGQVGSERRRRRSSALNNGK